MVKKVNYPLIFLILFCVVILWLVYTVSLAETPDFSEQNRETSTSVAPTEEMQETKIREKAYGSGIKDISILIDCIAINNPDKFTSPKKADKTELVKIAFWCILLGRSCENFDFTGKKMLINKNQLEQMYLSLFGNTDFPTHKTIKSQGITFSFNEETGTYSVPITGITPGYTANIISKKEKKGALHIKAELIPTDKWTQDTDGKIVSPKAQKHLTITVKKKADGSFSLLSVADK